MVRSLFQRPRGGVISFDDTDDRWRRRNVDFEQHQRPAWSRLPLIVKAILVVAGATLALLWGSLVFLVVGGLLTR